MCCEAVLGLPVAPLTPGADALRRHVSLDPVPPSVGVARRFVREALADVPPDELDAALLMASELVTNAILHARTAVELGVIVDEGRLLVCVADRLPGGPLTPRSHSRDRPGGRGLALVADLSEHWGTVSTSGGKAVWFTLPVSVRAVSVR